MKRTCLYVTLLGFGGLVACSSEHETGHSVIADTACARDTRKDAYVAGLEKKTASFSIKLVESKPGPPTKGTNEMVLLVADLAGTPIDGATVTVVPWMPDHAHGTAMKPTTSSMGGGLYRVTPVSLTMAGLWQIKVAVQRTTNGSVEEAMFQFCLDG
jgi:hypothetical protein